MNRNVNGIKKKKASGRNRDSDRKKMGIGHGIGIGMDNTFRSLNRTLEPLKGSLSSWNPIGFLLSNPKGSNESNNLLRVLKSYLENQNEVPRGVNSTFEDSI